MDLQSDKKTDLFKSGASLFGGLTIKKDQRNSILKKDLNLLPRSVLDQRRFNVRYKKACFLFVELLLMACALLSVPYILMLTDKFDKNTLQTNIDSISAIEDLEKQALQSRSQLKSKQDVITNLNKNDSVIYLILTTMEKAIPKTMYLSSVSQVTNEIKGENGNVTGVQKSIIVKGISKDKDSVADFQKSLKDMNMYKEVFVSNIKEADMINESTLKISEINDTGEVIDKEIPVVLDFNPQVQFDMECIINDWK